MPYGGVKDSGLGREGVRFAIEDMTEIRLLVVRTPPAADGADADPGRRRCGPDTIGRVSGVASVREVLARERAGGSVTVRGWLRTTRHSKGLSFLELSDGSCFAGLQVVAEPALAELRERGRARSAPAARCRSRARSSIRRARGSATSCARRASSWSGGVAADYPLQKKRHTFEFLRTIAHLRPRTNTIGAVLRVRSAATPGDPPVLPGARLPVPPHARDHGVRRRGRGRAVPRHDDRPEQPAARRRRPASTGARTSSGARRS